VEHESSGNAHAANENTNGSFDVGVWQINSGNWASWYVWRGREQEGRGRVRVRGEGESERGERGKQEGVWLSTTSCWCAC
jgi:hypothetical protein